MLIAVYFCFLSSRREQKIGWNVCGLRVCVWVLSKANTNNNAKIQIYWKTTQEKNRIMEQTNILICAPPNQNDLAFDVDFIFVCFLFIFLHDLQNWAKFKQWSAGKWTSSAEGVESFVISLIQLNFFGIRKWSVVDQLRSRSMKMERIFCDVWKRLFYKCKTLVRFSENEKLNSLLNLRILNVCWGFVLNILHIWGERSSKCFLLLLLSPFERRARIKLLNKRISK